MQLSLLLAVFCIALGANAFAVPDKKPNKPKVPTVSLGDGEYYFVFDEVASWYDAMEYCEMEGLQLLTIDTPEENEIIKQYIKDNGMENYDVFTAGTSIGRGDQFYWATSGEDFSFTDWLPNEVTTGKCMILYWSHWLHLDCVKTARFICEVAPK